MEEDPLVLHQLADFLHRIRGQRLAQHRDLGQYEVVDANVALQHQYGARRLVGHPALDLEPATDDAGDEARGREHGAGIVAREAELAMGFAGRRNLELDWRRAVEPPREGDLDPAPTPAPCPGLDVVQHVVVAHHQLRQIRGHGERRRVLDGVEFVQHRPQIEDAARDREFGRSLGVDGDLGGEVVPEVARATHRDSLALGRGRARADEERVLALQAKLLDFAAAAVGEGKREVGFRRPALGLGPMQRIEAYRAFL